MERWRRRSAGRAARARFAFLGGDRGSEVSFSSAPAPSPDDPSNSESREQQATIT